VKRVLLVLTCVCVSAVVAAEKGDVALGLDGGWWTPQGALADSHGGLWCIDAAVAYRVLDEIEIYGKGFYGECEFVEDFWESGVPDFEPRGRLLAVGFGARYGFPLDDFFPYLRAGATYGVWLSHQPVPEVGWYPAQSESLGIDVGLGLEYFFVETVSLRLDVGYGYYFNLEVPEGVWQESEYGDYWMLEFDEEGAGALAIGLGAAWYL